MVTAVQPNLVIFFSTIFLMIIGIVHEMFKFTYVKVSAHFLVFREYKWYLVDIFSEKNIHLKNIAK